jgi:hypothetical protein
MAIYQSKYTGKQIDDAIANQKKMSEIVIRNSKQIENLKQGTADQFETDTAVAYVKNVPENALPYAEIKKIGGMTYKDGNTLKSAKVTEVESMGVNLLSEQFLITATNATEDGNYIKFSNQITKVSNTWFKSNTVYTLSFVGKIDEGNGRLAINYTDGTVDNAIINSTTDVSVSIKSNSEKTIASIGTSYGGSGNVWIKKGTLMLYEGATAFSYTPYALHTLPIPEAVQAIDGYGLGINDEVYNYVDWENNQFVKRVGKVDMGTLDWGIYAGYIHATLTKTPKQHAVGICAPYDVVTFNYSLISNGQMVIYDNGFSADAKIILKDDSYTDVATLKTAMSGVMLVYELATPEITDISDIITADNLIEVEGGGTLTFKNKYKYAVPSEVEYQVEV